MYEPRTRVLSAVLSAIVRRDGSIYLPVETRKVAFNLGNRQETFRFLFVEGINVGTPCAES